MIDHVCFDVSNLSTSKSFYEKALLPLGYKVQMEFKASGKRRADVVAFGKTQKPDFWLSKGSPAISHIHIAFAADNINQVNEFYQLAMESGGRDNGKPGLRPEYHPGYYGAFVFDPDGYNVEVVFHDFSWAASQKLHSEDQVKIVKQIYAGINANDFDSVLKLFDEHVIRKEFEGSPAGGIYHGLLDLRRNFETGRSSWAEGACEPVEFVPSGNKIVVTAHIKVRLKIEPQWIDTHTTDGFSFKDGLVTEFHSFVSKAKAFEWAGISLPITEPS